MADGLEVNLTGVEPIIARLRKLPEAAGNRAARRALRRGGNVIKAAAQAGARAIDDPATADAIYRNLAVVSGGRRREALAGGPMMRVGVRGGARPLKKGTETGLPGGNTTHWRFNEFGTSEARAQPFMRPAMESAANGALEATVLAMGPELDKELTKLGIK